MEVKITQADASTWIFDEAGVRFFLLAGTERALLIDSGMMTRNAKELADWAKGTGNVDFDDKGEIIKDAFLLNCANTAAAVAVATPVAEAAIKITAITIVDGVPQLTYPSTYGNGQVVIQGSATIGSTASWHDGKQSTDRFFRTTLKLK